MVIFLPVFESRHTIVRTTRLMFRDLLGLRKGGRLTATEGEVVVEGTDSPPPEKLAEAIGVKRAD